MAFYQINHDTKVPQLISKDKIAHQLAEIQLDKDGVIIINNPYVLKDQFGFHINSFSTMDLSSRRYMIPCVIFLPVEYTIDIKSSLLGVRINQIRFDQIQSGFEIKDKIKITDDDILNLTQSSPDYIIYKNIHIFFKMYDRMLANSDESIIGNFVSSNKHIFDMFITSNHMGYSHQHPLENLYLIQSNYLYERAPDF